LTGLTDDDLHLFNEGTHYQLHQQAGRAPRRRRHPVRAVGPQRRAVEVLGDWNYWQGGDWLSPRGSSGLWEGRAAHAAVGHRYKFRIHARGGEVLDKADPFAAAAETPPATASIIWRAGPRSGSDAAWMAGRHAGNRLDAPWSIYEVHLGSWMREHGDRGAPLDYRALGERLAEHCRPPGLHPRRAPAGHGPPVLRLVGLPGHRLLRAHRRYGTPDDLMAMIDTTAPGRYRA
jgi:1,4-alpha-glucan branching enzyme